MATTAVLRAARRYPLTVVSISALTTSITYANLIERETESRETLYRQSAFKDEFFRLDVSKVDRVTNREKAFFTSPADASVAPACLPIRYDANAISRYWEARPVSVAERLFQIAGELGPLLWAYARDFKLAGAVSKEAKLTEDEILIMEHTHAAKLRHALTRLGPAFVKIGQQLSIRPDLVPPPVLAELQKLCDSVEPVPDSVAMEMLRTELGFASVEEISAIFSNMHRVAAASLGQVYKATVRETGQTVAIKVQRPDMKQKLSLDLFLLQCYGRMVDRICSVLTEQIPYHENFIDSFAQGSYMELDYEHEAENQTKFKTQFEKRGCKVVVPSVLNQYTSRRVICSEWIDGIKLVDASQDQIRRLIPVGVELFLTQLLDIGAFHADPHPANLYVTDSGKLCLLDFGLVANVDENARRAMTAAIVNLLVGDFDTLIATDAKRLGFLPEDLDTTELNPILKKILKEGLVEAGSSMKERKRKLMDISNELNEVFFRYPFSVPPFFALVTRGLGLLEGIALTGDKNFDIFQAAGPYAKKRAVAIFGSHYFARKLKRKPTIVT